MVSKDFLYGLSKMTFNGAVMGYIEKDSFDWGGKKPDSADVEAEQVPTGPVLSLPQSNGTIAPTFNMIQLNYQNMADLLGGTATTTGWSAPSTIVEKEGTCEIETPSGKKISIKKARLIANISGKLSMKEVSKIACELKVLDPGDGTPPYSIDDIVAV